MYVHLQAKFVNGKPDRIEARYIMRSTLEWDRFMVCSAWSTCLRMTPTLLHFLLWVMSTTSAMLTAPEAIVRVHAAAAAFS